jgi:hypothetical protein
MPRAIVNEPKPGLRLHMLAPQDGEPILCWTPRHRYFHELVLESTPDIYWAWWNVNLMPKVVVRRQGTDLDSTFVAVWEPFQQTPSLTDAVLLPDIPERDGVGVRMRAPSTTATILYRRPESQATLKTDTLTTNGRFTTLRADDAGNSLDLVEGTEAAAGPLSVKLAAWPTLPVIGQGIGNGQSWLLLKGSMPAYPADPERQPHAGKFARFVQKGQSNWWLPVAQVESTPSEDTKLTLSREIGFVYDAKNELLRESFFPFRSMTGAACVEFPCSASVTWDSLSADIVILKVTAAAPVEIRLLDDGKRSSARIRNTGTDAWSDLPIRREANALIIALPLELLGAGWSKIEVK